MLNRVRCELALREEFTVSLALMDNQSAIDQRLRDVPKKAAGPLKTALTYLYMQEGPTNLENKRYRVAEPYLTKCEVVLARYLKTRTNGNNRRIYGKEALKAARLANYRCQVCNESDVRLLILDHAHGRDNTSLFFLLCANCHQMKSRIFDWSGKKRPSADQEVLSISCPSIAI